MKRPREKQREAEICRKREKGEREERGEASVSDGPSPRASVLNTCYLVQLLWLLLPPPLLFSSSSSSSSSPSRVQVAGRKRVVLFSPAHFRNLYNYPLFHPCDRQVREGEEKRRRRGRGGRRIICMYHWYYITKGGPVYSFPPLLYSNLYTTRISYPPISRIPYQTVPS